MKKLIATMMLAACLATEAKAQDDILSLVPQRDSLGRVPTTSNIDSLLITGMPSNRAQFADQQELDAFIDYITGRTQNQRIFFRGTADVYRFQDATSDADNDLRNLALATSRAGRAMDFARVRNIDAQIINPPLINQPRGRRGVWVYKVTYEDADVVARRNTGAAAVAAPTVATATDIVRPAPALPAVRQARVAPEPEIVVRYDSVVRTDTVFVVQQQEPEIVVRYDSVVRTDTVIVVQQQEPEIVVRYDSTVTIDSVFVITRDTILDPAQTRWYFGVGAGPASLFTFGGGGMEFVTPVTLSAFAQHDNRWFVTVAGGWRPMSEVTLGGAFPANMNRAESMASLTAAVYPKRGFLGVALGWRGAWETVRREDEYIERAFGMSLGPRLRFTSHWLVLGLDFQVSNESRFRQGETAWRFGIAPSISVNHTFGRRRRNVPAQGPLQPIR